MEEKEINKLWDCGDGMIAMNKETGQRWFMSFKDCENFDMAEYFEEENFEEAEWDYLGIDGSYLNKELGS